MPSWLPWRCAPQRDPTRPAPVAGLLAILLALAPASTVLAQT
jgi:hypothetical protein